MIQKIIYFSKVLLNYGHLPLTPTYEPPKYDIKKWTDHVNEGFNDFTHAYVTCNWVAFFEKFEAKISYLVHQPDNSNTTEFSNNEDYLQSWNLINSQNQYLLGKAMHSHMIATKLKMGLLNPSVSKKL